MSSFYTVIVFLLNDLTLIDIHIILINNKITAKAAFNPGKCKKIIKFSRNSAASGGLRTPDPLPGLRPGPHFGLPSPRPSTISLHHWFTAQIPPYSALTAPFLHVYSLLT